MLSSAHRESPLSTPFRLIHFLEQRAELRFEGSENYSDLRAVGIVGDRSVHHPADEFHGDPPVRAVDAETGTAQPFIPKLERTGTRLKRSLAGVTLRCVAWLCVRFLASWNQRRDALHEDFELLLLISDWP